MTQGKKWRDVAWHYSALVTLTVLMSFGVASCDRTRPSVQYEKGANALTNFIQAPLAVPPEFGLRPMASGIGEGRAATHAAREQEVEVAGNSIGTASLLRTVGIDQIFSDIRALIDREASVTITEAPVFIDRLMFLRVLDPRSEQAAVLNREPVPLPLEVAPLGEDSPRRSTSPPKQDALRPVVPPLPPPTIRRAVEKGQRSLF